MIEKAARDRTPVFGVLAVLHRASDAVRRFAEDVSDTVVSWWRARHSKGPPIPMEDVKRRYGL